MPSIRQYPQATALNPTDAFLVDRVGVGTMYALASAMCGQIANASASVSTGFVYTVRTAAGAYTLTLPLLSDVAEGLYLDIQDGDFNAATNHITVNSQSPNFIYNGASSSSSFVISANSAIYRFVRSNSVWRALQL